jgi:hypothetical protein
MRYVLGDVRLCFCKWSWIPDWVLLVRNQRKVQMRFGKLEAGTYLFSFVQTISESNNHGNYHNRPSDLSC